MLEGIPWVPSVGVGVLDTRRGPCRGAWTPYILQAVVDVVDLMLLPLLHVEQHDNLEPNIVSVWNPSTGSSAMNY